MGKGSYLTRRLAGLGGLGTMGGPRCTTCKVVLGQVTPPSILENGDHRAQLPGTYMTSPFHRFVLSPLESHKICETYLRCVDPVAQCVPIFCVLCGVAIVPYKDYGGQNPPSAALHWASKARAGNYHNLLAYKSSGRRPVLTLTCHSQAGTDSSQCLCYCRRPCVGGLSHSPGRPG